MAGRAAPGRARPSSCSRTASSSARWSSRSRTARGAAGGRVGAGRASSRPAACASAATGRARPSPTAAERPRARGAARRAASTLSEDFATVAWRKLAVNAVAGLMVLARRRAGDVRAAPTSPSWPAPTPRRCFAVAPRRGRDPPRTRSTSCSPTTAACPRDLGTSMLFDAEAGARSSGRRATASCAGSAARHGIATPVERRRGAAAGRRVRPDGIIRFMDPWVIWLIAAVIFAVGEIATLGFFLAPFAGGALVAALVSAVGGGDADLAAGRSCSSRACCSPRCGRSPARTAGCPRSCARAPRRWSAAPRW